ncbi:MAG: acyl-CoA dehydrogenase family protein [Bacillota bacterium]|nr:acyl-CoA dehydrogenase family protein [Bacillota bacterium]
MSLFVDRDLEALKAMARDVAQRELAPRSREGDETGAFPRESLRILFEAGFLGMMVPREWGGGGLGHLAHALVLEEVAKVDSSLAVLMEVHNTLHLEGLLRFGREKLKEEVIPHLLKDSWGGFALTEPQAGSDAKSIRTRAKREGDTWVLEGEKAFITGAGEAAYYIVFAQAPEGITAFHVPGNAPGLSAGAPLQKMGIRSAVTGSLYLDGVRIPDERRLAEPGEGLKMALSLLDGGRVGIGAQALGLAQAALEKSLAHAREREQFGQKIGDFQGIRFKLAEMATEIEGARALVYRAAALLDQGGRHTLESSQAKLFASKVAVRACLEAIQIHGGAGYIQDVGVERLLRDAKATEIYEGTSEIQKVIIARHLLGEA